MHSLFAFVLRIFCKIKKILRNHHESFLNVLLKVLFKIDEYFCVQGFLLKYVYFKNFLYCFKGEFK